MYWVVKNSLDESKLEVVWRKGQVPKNSIVKAPIDQLTGKPEEGKWLTIQDVVNPETNEIEKRAVVDQALKSQILNDRAQAQADRDAAKAERDADIARLFQRAATFQKEEIVSLESVRDAIFDIVEVLRYMNQVK